MSRPEQTPGPQGRPAPEWKVALWADGAGNPIPPITLHDSDGQWRIVFCFQSWCPGCHSEGLPTLRRLVDGLADQPGVVFLAVQTVFEGFEANTFEAMQKFRVESGLSIPFGHDPGDATTHHRSNILTHYQTGGTPWFILIGPDNRIVFDDFRLNTDGAIKAIKSAIAEAQK